MYELLALLTQLLSCYLLVRVIKTAGAIEFILVFFCLLTAQIAACGYLLSAVNLLGDIRYWAALGMLLVCVSAVIVYLDRDVGHLFLHRISFIALKQHVASAMQWYREETSGLEKLLITPLILVTILIAILNLAIIVSTAPNNWDSMSYHLARMAYYLQHNNLDYFPANYWAQVVHPKNSTLFLIYSFLISGRNENLTQLVQFVSYLVSICSVYGISIKIGNTRTQSVFSALVSALLIDWLMESTTTQNDMILTAYFGATIYFLFAFRKTLERKYIALAALGIGLSVGTKASSFLALPSLAVVLLHVFVSGRDTIQNRLRNLASFAALTIVALCLFALPSGYMDNYRHFGNPIGPPSVRQLHSFEGRSAVYVALNGTKNLLRFGSEFLSLDGLPAFDSVKRIQKLLRALPIGIVRNVGVDVENSEAIIGDAMFGFEKPPLTHEDFSYWGIFGFGLIWVVVLLSAFSVVKSVEARVLSLAALLFLVSQAFAGPYDPNRGRYFAVCAVFAVPTIGVSLRSRNNLIRTYLLLVVLIGCISALSSVVFKPNKALISANYQGLPKTSLFAVDRVAQLAATRPEFYTPLTLFDFLVPPCATVAVFLPEDSLEYPLFGEHLTRTIIPLNSFEAGFRSIPGNADYLLYDKGFPYPSSQDVYIGNDWYLRRVR